MEADGVGLSQSMVGLFSLSPESNLTAPCHSKIPANAGREVCVVEEMVVMKDGGGHS